MNRELSEKLSRIVSESGKVELSELIKRAVHLFESSEKFSELEAELRLANELKRVGEYRKASQIYEKLSELNTEDGKLKSIILNNYGALMQDMGDYQQALVLHEQSLQISQEVLGPDHPSVATTMNNLAAVYEAMGDYQQALVLYEQSLHISREVLGPDHPSVATTMNNLAAVYEAMGDYQQALVLYEQSLYLSINVYGSEHPDVARIYNNLAGCLVQMGLYKDAIDNYEKATRIMEVAFGDNNQFYLRVRENLNHLRRKMSKNAEQGAAPDARTSRR